MCSSDLELRSIVERTASANAALLAHCDEEVRSRIVGDARWWSSDPEVHGGAAPGPAISAPVEESDRLLDAGLRALVAADAAWRAEERARGLAEAGRDAEAAQRVALEAALAAAREEIERLSAPAAPLPRQGVARILSRLWRRAA